LEQLSAYKEHGRKGKTPGSSKPQPSPPRETKLTLQQIQQMLQDTSCMIQDLADQKNETTDHGKIKTIEDLIKQVHTRNEELSAQLWQQMGLQYRQPPPPTPGPHQQDARLGPVYSLATPGIYLTQLAGGTNAAYWIGADGQFKLLLEDGMGTS